MIDKKWESTNRNYQKLHSECIMVSIIGGLKFHVDQIHSGIRASNVDKLKSKERKNKKTKQPTEVAWLDQTHWTKIFPGTKRNKWCLFLGCLYYLFTCFCSSRLCSGILTFLSRVVIQNQWLQALLVLLLYRHHLASGWSECPKFL